MGLCASFNYHRSVRWYRGNSSDLPFTVNRCLAPDCGSRSHCSCTQNVPRIGHSATMPRYIVRSLLSVNLLRFTVAFTQHFSFNSSFISRIFTCFAIFLFNVTVTCSSDVKRICSMLFSTPFFFSAQIRSCQ